MAVFPKKFLIRDYRGLSTEKWGFLDFSPKVVGEQKCKNTGLSEMWMRTLLYIGNFFRAILVEKSGQNRFSGPIFVWFPCVRSVANTVAWTRQRHFATNP